MEDLPRHTLLHYADTPDWPNWLAAVGALGVDVARGPRFSEMTALLSSAEAGQGLAIARTSLVQHELQSGRLVRPFPGDAVDGRAYVLLTTARAQRQPKVSAFRTWLLRATTPA